MPALEQLSWLSFLLECSRALRNTIGKTAQLYIWWRIEVTNQDLKTELKHGGTEAAMVGPQWRIAFVNHGI